MTDIQRIISQMKERIKRMAHNQVEQQYNAWADEPEDDAQLNPKTQISLDELIDTLLSPVVSKKQTYEVQKPVSTKVGQILQRKELSPTQRASLHALLVDALSKRRVGINEGYIPVAAQEEIMELESPFAKVLREKAFQLKKTVVFEKAQGQESALISAMAKVISERKSTASQSVINDNNAVDISEWDEPEASKHMYALIDSLDVSPAVDTDMKNMIKERNLLKERLEKRRACIVDEDNVATTRAPLLGEANPTGLVSKMGSLLGSFFANRAQEGTEDLCFEDEENLGQDGKESPLTHDQYLASEEETQELADAVDPFANVDVVDFYKLLKSSQSEALLDTVHNPEAPELMDVIVHSGLKAKL